MAIVGILSFLCAIDMGDSNGRYLPFNLSTVVPFEATAAALRALPTIQPRPPAAPSLLPDVTGDDIPLDDETRDEMHSMLAETARDGEWLLGEDELLALSAAKFDAETPTWIQDLAGTLPRLLQENAPRPRHVPVSDPRPAKRSRSAVRQEAFPESRDSFGMAAGNSEDVARTEVGVDLEDEKEDQRDARVRQAQVSASEHAARRFVAVLDGLVDHVDALGERNGGDVHAAMLQVTANGRYMEELLQNVQVHAQQGVVSAVAETTLRSVVDILDVRLRAATSTVEAISELPPSVEHVRGAQLGLRAACILLTLLTAPKVPRSLFVQDTLEEVVGLLRLSGSHILYPACDPLFVLPKSIASAKKGPSYGDGGRDNGNGEDAAPVSTPKSGSGKMHVRKRVSELMELCSVACENLADLFAQEKGLAESLVSQALSYSIRSLSVDGVLVLQVCTIRVVEAIVASYSDNCDTVVDALLEVLSRLPANRRSLRGFRVSGGTQHVRVGSALLVRVLNVVGGCAPGRNPGSAPVVGDSPDALRRRCSVLVLRFVDEFLSRTFRERDAEMRTALQAFFVDMLELYASPEYPSAELVVQALGVRLGMFLNANSDISVQGRVMCLDMLGALAARMCLLYGAKNLQNNGDENLWADEILRPEVMKHRVAVLAYLKEQGKDDSSCGYAQLFHCMQFIVDDAEACEEAYKMKQVRDGQDDVASDGLAKGGRSEEFSNLRQEAMQRGSRVLTDAFQSMRGVYEGTRGDATASALYLSQRRPLVRGLSRIIDTVRDGLQQPEPTLRAKAIKTLSVVAEADPDVLRCVPALLNAIEQSCGDVSKSVREASLELLSRSLSTLTDCEPDSTRAGVGRGSFLRGSDFFEKVFPMVQQRLVDSATSVRKRAILIMHGVLTDILGEGCSIGAGKASNIARESKNRLEHIVVQICCTLADRLEDREASVRLAAERTLRLAMFGFDSSQLEAPCSRTEYESTAPTFASRLVAICSATLSNPKGTNSQRNVIQLVLNESIVAKKRPLLTQIVLEIVEILHATEAHLAGGSKSPTADKEDTGNSPTLNSQAQRRTELLNRRRVASTAALEAVAKVDAALVSDQCTALAPHLKGIVEIRRRGSLELLHVPRVLNILELCVPKAGRPFAVSRLAEVVRDVEKIVCMCPAPSIAPSAIRCFCSLAQFASDPEVGCLPEETSRIFYSFLDGAKDELVMSRPESNSEAIRNARQALPRLGLLARHGELSEDFVSEIYDLLHFLCSGLMRDWFLEAREPACVEPMQTPGKMPRICFGLRQSAVRSLTHLLVRHRSYLPKATPILVACLRQCGATPDFEAQMTVLSGMQDMLLEEEARNVAEAEKMGQDRKQARPGAKSNVVLAAEEDAEAGFLALCAQAIVPELDIVSRSENAEVRKIVVTVLGLLGRQGLVLPATIVPALFGLLADGNALCRESALFVVGFLADRYPGMLSSAAMRGLQRSFSHAFRTHPRSNMTENALVHITKCAVDVKSGYALVSPGLMHIQRQQRRSILCGIVREFDPKAKVVVIATTARANSNRAVGANLSENAPTSVGGMILESAAGGCEAHSAATDPGAKLALNVPRGSTEASREGIACTTTEKVVHDDDDDDDVGVLQRRGGHVKLRARGASAPPSTLAFYAATLATMDYASGSGIGGSLTIGGGTSVADAKLKAAREDVLEVVSVASRIISNSGQAVLQAVKESFRTAPARQDEKVEIAEHALPLCMLLLVKQFLKETRWNFEVPDCDREEYESGEAAFPVPPFGISKLLFPPLEAISPSFDFRRDFPVGDVDAMLEVFQDLMRSDSIDEAEANVGTSGRRRKPQPRSGQAVSRRKAKPGVKRRAGVKATAARFGTAEVDDEDVYTEA